MDLYSQASAEGRAYPLCVARHLRPVLHGRPTPMTTDYLQPRLVSIQQARTLLGIGQTKTYELITEGLLETITIGSRRLVTLRSIDALVEGAAMNRAA